MDKNRRFKILVIGFGVLLIGAVVIPGQLELREIKKRDQVIRDWEGLRTPLLSYGIDRCGVYLPPDTTWRRESGQNVPLTFETDPGYVDLPGEGNGPDSFHFPLTTPVAYTADLPTDPFRPGQPYGWMIYPAYGQMAYLGVLQSTGPDRDIDVDLAALREEMQTAFPADEYPTGPDLVAFANHVESQYLYDPTNGIASSGDMLWVFRNNNFLFGSDDVRDKELAQKIFSLPDWNRKVESIDRQGGGAESGSVAILPAGLVEVLDKHQIDLASSNPLASTELRELQNRFVVLEESLFADPMDTRKVDRNILKDVVKNLPPLVEEVGKATNRQPVVVAAENAASALPLLGKGMIAMAAHDFLVLGNRSAAEERLDALAVILGVYETSPLLGSHERRIVGELRRLDSQLREAIVALDRGDVDSGRQNNL